MATTSAAFAGLVDKVAFINKLPMLHKATSDDESPTPGYMYPEITNISFESTGYCQSLLDFLVDRLNKKSYYVKAKVLRVMKHTVVNGHTMFRQGLRRSAKGIKDATSFTGPIDPLHGHAPYIAVRKAAEELLEILFDTEKSQKSSSALSASNQGMPGGGSGSKMEGFGNTLDAPKKTLGESVLGNLKDFAENIMDPYALVAAKSREEQNVREYKLIGDEEATERNNFSTAPRSYTSSRGDYKSMDVNVSSVPGNPDVKRLQSGKSSTDYKAGKAGGGWEEGRESDGVSNGDEQKSKDSTDLAEKLESVSITDWSQEQKLVDEITAPGGVKPIPSRDALTKFIKRSTTLNCDKIVEFLNEKIMDPSSQVQLKALCVLESLLKADLVSTDYTSVLKTNLENLCQTSQGSSKTKAVKILRQLDCMEKALSSPATTPESQTSYQSLIPGFSSSDIEVNSGNASTDSHASVGAKPDVNADIFSVSSEDKVLAESQSQLFSGMSVQSSGKSEGTPKSIGRTNELLLLEGFESPSKDLGSAKVDLDNSNSSKSDEKSILHQFESDALKSTSASNGTKDAAKVPDPLMSRTANMSDLLSSIGMSDSIQNSQNPLQGVTHQSPKNSPVRTVNELARTSGSPLHQTSSPQHHATLAAYPQLSTANLSSNSTVPLRFSQSRTDSFEFMSSETENKSNTSGAFSFVLDAMKASKK
ncbi:AP-4 complex accessory subunit tepsin-like [Ptychodera flava]|uniref:AP-4 complex accessory subunit tepsin-like n=1 Tax=Ptychodera flava TaxID=63121 RepID=UPI00396A63E9